MRALRQFMRWVGLLSAAMMATMAAVLGVLNIDGVVGSAASLYRTDELIPTLVLLLGFLIILAALCGAFRPEEKR